MKKLISILLALVFVFSMATVAMATTTTPSYTQDNVTYTDMGSVTITKTYKTVNGGESPAETFALSTLTCTGVKNVPDGVTTTNVPVPTVTKSATFAQGVATAQGATDTFTITLPAITEYPGVGEYTYTFTETASENAGVSTYTTNMKLVVTIVQDGNNGRLRIAGVHCEDSKGTKTAAFENTYTAASLTVSKQVDGNLGDRTKDFTINVKFTNNTGKKIGAPITYGDNQTVDFKGGTEATIPVTLKHGQSITFANIPEGVSYEVEEEDYSSLGYSAKYNNQEVEKVSGNISDTDVTVTVTNIKRADVDTGISLDSVPFILILAVCAGAAVLFVTKRRSVEF